MPTSTNHLNQLLRQNPQLIAAWYDDPQQPNELHVAHQSNSPLELVNLSTYLRALTLVHHTQKPLRTLIAPVATHHPRNPQQECQNEPVQLGCQIQPHNANWVGTAGAPVRWIDPAGHTRHGILSNWHVMANGGEHLGRPIYQPDDTYPKLAHLDSWQTVHPETTNLFDAALADAFIDGYHTIAQTILDLGQPSDQISNAHVNLAVCKSGRTTGYTTAQCLAIGAAVRVSYGHFSATFTDQDIFTDEHEPFSAPGDSGSLILTDASHSPVSLLFAGNGELTVGNPIRYIADAFNLNFSFN